MHPSQEEHYASIKEESTPAPTLPTIAVPFTTRGKYLDPENGSSYFMSLLLTGRESDFKIALHDTENGYIAVHSIILITRSGFFDTLFKSHMRESAERWISFGDFEDGTILDAMECIYSCSIDHMKGCSPQELADLISFLAYIDHRGSTAISSLFSLVLEVKKNSRAHILPLLIVLEQIISLGIVNVIPKQSLESAHQLLASDLVYVTMKDLGAVGVEALCKLTVTTFTTWLDATITKYSHNCIQLLLNFIAVWTSYDPNHRIPHTIKILQSNKIFSSDIIRPYTLPSDQVGAVSMVNSLELKKALPEYFEKRPATSELLLCQLELTLVRLDRDSLVAARR